MISARSLASILALALVAADLHAQGIANANPAVRGSSFSWGASRSGRPRSFSLSGYYGFPVGYGYPSSFSAVTVLQPYPPPIVVIVVPRRESRAEDRDQEDRPPEGVVRIRPHRDRDRAREEPPPEEPIPRPVPPADQPELIPAPQPLLRPQPRRIEPPGLEPPPAEAPKDPLAESARHLAIGKSAFAAGEYGRAAFRFRKAAELTPDLALPHFFLSQALLALGKYRDAVDAIHAGLALDPTWPATGQRLRSLYGPDNHDFAQHVQQLEAARLTHIDDPVLLFLQGVVLWFDDRQNDARPFFEKAAPLVPDRRDIDRFLQAK